MKHILISGGSDGLGKVAAAKLQAAGHSVTILGKDEARTKGAAKEIDCKYVVADVADAAVVQRAVEQAGQVDVLINSAGLWVQDALDTNDPGRIKEVLEVNTLGTMLMTQAVLPGMKVRKAGRIINVISQAGLSAKAERAPYNASKWAITGFTKSTQLELKPFGIAVTGFYPGAMDTGLFEKSGNARDMSRALDPAIAADALVYICSLPNEVDVPEFGIQSLNY
jgi:NADP-dependent 3-hydroxy acid dehydrogenase YdfG